MASLSTMRGNIISGGTGAPDGRPGDSLEGRAFSTPAGAINIDGITAFTPIGCGSPVLTGPHAPPLGSAACYTIFSANEHLTVTYHQLLLVMWEAILLLQLPDGMQAKLQVFFTLLLMLLQLCVHSMYENFMIR